MIQRGRSRFLLAICVVAVGGVGCAADPPDAHTSASASGVEVYARGCAAVAEHGSGTAFGGHLVATVAHVVAGATSIDVVADGIHHAASIAAIDTHHDTAVLRVADLDRSPIELRSASAGEAGSYLGFGGNDPGIKPFNVKRRIVLDSEDIYVKGDYPRAGYDLSSTTVAGDSGAGLIVDGALAGVIWARSERSDSQAYAVDISEFRPLLDSIAAAPTGATAPAVPCR